MFIFVFLFGISVGSFLNVVIYRSNHDDSIARGRSYCPNCKHTLSFFDLIPLLSFVFLLGKCRYCGKRISWQYPLVEITTGLLAVFLWMYISDLSFSGYLRYLLLFGIFSSFLVIFVSDFLYKTVLMIPLGIGTFFSLIYLILTKSLVIGNFYSALGSFVFFSVLNFVSKGKWMGLGDAFLGFFIGIFLGWPKTFISLYLAFLTGAFIGVILILLRKKRFGQKIAFGPFLIIGTVITFFYGTNLWKFFINFIGMGIPWESF